MELPAAPGRPPVLPAAPRPASRAPPDPRPWAADATAPASRLTLSFGTYRIGLCFERNVLFGDASGWLEAQGLPADLEATFAVAEPRRTPSVHFSRFDSRGYAFSTPYGHGEADWETAAARVTLDRAVCLPDRVGVLAEACRALGYAEVLRRGGLLLHGATLCIEGRAYVVVGSSGAGKSTLADRFPGAHLHDEHAWLVPGAGGCWQAWRHAEFRGPREDLPWQVPLAGVFVLGPDRSVTAATPLAGAERTAAVLVHGYHAGAASAGPMLDSVASLGAAVPVFALSHHLSDPPGRVAAILHEACHVS